MGYFNVCFNVGDVVRRIGQANEGGSGSRIEVGDVLTVNKVNTSGWLFFEGPFTGGSNPGCFELVSKRGFKVGDKVRRKPEYRRTNEALDARVVTVTEVSTFAGSAWIDYDYDPHTSGGFADRFDLVEAAPTAPVVEHTSRANDPATSVAAGKVKRTSLREKVWVAMTTTAFVGNGLTGHELAKVVDAPLNSVTPRLAELRRAEKIKDSGQRRDKQIVWVLA